MSADRPGGAAGSEAVNHFMFAVTNLHTDGDEHSLLRFPRSGKQVPSSRGENRLASPAPTTAFSPEATRPTSRPFNARTRQRSTTACPTS
jgi:hypothetical protein